jgi:hypothetical protein
MVALQAANDALTFVGPYLLNLLVSELSAARRPAPGGAGGSGFKGVAVGTAGAAGASDDTRRRLWSLAGLLGASLALKALLNTQYNYRLSLVVCR